MLKREQWVGKQNKVELTAAKLADGYLIESIRSHGERILHKRYAEKFPEQDAENAKRVAELLKPINYKLFSSLITQVAFQFDGRTDGELEDDMESIGYAKDNIFLRRQLIINADDGLPQDFLIKRMIHATKGAASETPVGDLIRMMDEIRLLNRQRGYSKSPLVSVSDDFKAIYLSFNDYRRDSEDRLYKALDSEVKTCTCGKLTVLPTHPLSVLAACVLAASLFFSSESKANTSWESAFQTTTDTAVIGKAQATDGNWTFSGDDSTLNIAATDTLSNGFTGYANYRLDSALSGFDTGGDSIQVANAIGYGQMAGDILADVVATQNAGISYTNTFGGVTLGLNWSPAGNENTIGAGVKFSAGGFGIGIGAGDQNDASALSIGASYAIGGAQAMWLSVDATSEAESLEQMLLGSDKKKGKPANDFIQNIWLSADATSEAESLEQMLLGSDKKKGKPANDFIPFFKPVFYN